VKHYVCGFAFHTPVNVAHPTEVALIQKAKPDFLKSLWNGIGGLVEPSDGSIPHKSTYTNAMSREFREEAGVITTPAQWRVFCRLRFRDCTIVFLESRWDFYGGPDDVGFIETPSTQEAEPIRIYTLSSLAKENYSQCVPNLRWLIPMALDKDQVVATVEDPS